MKEKGWEIARVKGRNRYRASHDVGRFVVDITVRDKNAEIVGIEFLGTDTQPAGQYAGWREIQSDRMALARLLVAFGIGHILQFVQSQGHHEFRSGKRRSVTLTDYAVDRVDLARGRLSRSAYIETLITKHANLNH
jgi:hypothetical protein